MLSDYLNQKVKFAPALRDGEGGAMTDCRGNILYGPEADIPARLERRVKETLFNDRQVTKIWHTYYSVIEVRAGDMLDGRRVLRSEAWAGLDGEIVVYMAAVCV